jgi:xanthine dehydrogenase accessory factor
MNTPHEFGPLRAGLENLRANGFAGGAALATLTRTFGSTFRRAGARMLVCGDGTVVRGLSGGCPEADIIARAHEVIANGSSRIVRYDRENGLDALLELGCGGELEVLIEPLPDATALAFSDAAALCLEQRANGVLATVFMVDGRCLAPLPQRLVWRGAVRVNSIVHPGLAAAVVAHAAALKPQAPTVILFEVEGQTYDVLFETLIPPHALSIIGATASAVALARIGADLGWAVTLVDQRYDLPLPTQLPPTVRRLGANPNEVAARLILDARSFAVVMTHNLERDIEYLRVLGQAPLAYLGAIGSRQRARKLLDGCGNNPNVRAPAGLDLGSETPEEIALAIAAEILAVSHSRRAQPLGETTGPIH